MNNLNPIYLMEGGFLGATGVKTTLNGIKKNGVLTTLRRNAESLTKRGEHIAKTRGAEKASIEMASHYDKNLFKNAGKAARKGKHQSSETSRKLHAVTKTKQKGQGTYDFSTRMWDNLRGKTKDF